MPTISNPTTTHSDIRPAIRCWSESPSTFQIRYGGPGIAPRVTAAGKFAGLLPGVCGVEALGVAETIRLKVQQWSDAPTFTTVSIGVASLTPAAAMEWSVLVKAADKALYAAKANGRNQSVLASIPKLSLVA